MKEKYMEYYYPPVSLFEKTKRRGKIAEKEQQVINEKFIKKVSFKDRVEKKSYRK